jgi:hypothetical protein
VVDQGKRHCIFCGNLADSREHLLPEWLQEVLPSDKPVMHFWEMGGIKRKPWEKKPFREKSKMVCEGCNTGWMSRLEDMAKPVLAPAIARTKACLFDLQAQWTAARWATKTVYVLQAQGPQLLAPPVHPLLLKENVKPPQEVSVWVGSHARAVDDPISTAYVQQPLALLPDEEHLKEPRNFGYLGFLAVGGISFLVVGHRFRNYVECILGEEGRHPASELFIKIWPRARKVVPWPPPLLMDRELLDLIFDPDTLPLGFDARVFPGSRHHRPPFSEAY